VICKLCCCLNGWPAYGRSSKFRTALQKLLNLIRLNVVFEIYTKRFLENFFGSYMNSITCNLHKAETEFNCSPQKRVFVQNKLAHDKILMSLI
jgi:hypothetical protein